MADAKDIPGHFSSPNGTAQASLGHRTRFPSQTSRALKERPIKRRSTVFLSNPTTWRSNSTRECDIRRALTETDRVECMVPCPANSSPTPRFPPVWVSHEKQSQVGKEHRRFACFSKNQSQDVRALLAPLRTSWRNALHRRPQPLLHERSGVTESQRGRHPRTSPLSAFKLDDPRLTQATRR